MYRSQFRPAVGSRPKRARTSAVAPLRLRGASSLLPKVGCAWGDGRLALATSRSDSERMRSATALGGRHRPFVVRASCGCDFMGIYRGMSQSGLGFQIQGANLLRKHGAAPIRGPPLPGVRRELPMGKSHRAFGGLCWSCKVQGVAVIKGRNAWNL